MIPNTSFLEEPVDRDYWAMREAELQYDEQQILNLLFHDLPICQVVAHPNDDAEGLDYEDIVLDDM